MPVGRDWPIIVGGSHRSGTTLVRRLLNGHSAIFCPPEIKFHSSLLLQFPNDPFAHARLGTTITALGLPTETWLDAFGRAFVACYEQARTNAGKRRWADKNPENAVNAHHWDRLLGGRMAFVLVVRHPLDVIASMEEVGMKKSLPADAVGRARHVRAYTEAGLRFADAHPDRSFTLRYEDLVLEPESSVLSLAAFLGETSEGMIENLAGDHGSGLEDPKTNRHDGISSANVGRWRRDLDAGDARAASTVVEGICRRFGYATPAAEE